MAITDYKVSETYSGRDIASLSDRPNQDGLTAAQLKARFDQLGKEVIPNYNDLIDFIEANLFSGGSTNTHTHNVDNLEDGTVNRNYTQTDKTKLDGIASGAEVNQYAFSSIKVGSTTGNANSKTATFEIVAGLNIVASIDPLTNKVTLSATGTLATQAVQSLIDDIGNYFTSLEVNGALQEIGASLYPSLSKTTPVNADTILLSDSASSGVFKKLSWANIKATLKTYFDTIYQAVLVSGTNIKTINGNSVLGSGNLSTDWGIINATLTYASADSPTFVANTSINLTSVISVGMKLKLTQTTVKYFIVTAITSTTITLYGGTDYTLANASITLPYFSSMKAPFGFPMNPSKWTIAFTVNTATVTNSPVVGTWYNYNTYVFPIGLWKVSYLLGMYPIRPTDGIVGSKCTLSTTNNGETNSDLSSLIYMTPVAQCILQSTLTDYLLDLTSRTNYYLNLKTDYASLTSIQFWTTPTPRVYLICAYL